MEQKTSLESAVVVPEDGSAVPPVVRSVAEMHNKVASTSIETPIDDDDNCSASTLHNSEEERVATAMMKVVMMAFLFVGSSNRVLLESLLKWECNCSKIHLLLTWIY